MKYTRLGNTELTVSRLVLGCEQLGGTDWGAYDKESVKAAVNCAVDMGVTTFDVADVYGLGHAEEILAESLGPRRKDMVIVTKFGVNWRGDDRGGRARTFLDATPKHVREALEASLRRLKLDCIPLYLVHWPDPATPVEDTIAALTDCRDKGLIRYFGVSNFATGLVREAGAAGDISALELQYNLLDRRPDESQLDYASKSGLGVLAYGVLAQGMLTGKYGPDAVFGSDDRRHRLPHFSPENREKISGLLSRLRDMSEQYGKSQAQIAINWVLGNSTITGAIVGSKTVQQVTDNVGALDWVMPAEDYAWLSDSCTEARLIA